MKTPLAAAIEDTGKGAAMATVRLGFGNAGAVATTKMTVEAVVTIANAATAAIVSAGRVATVSVAEMPGLPA